MIQAGEMRYDIIIQKKIIVKDNYGAQATTFTDYLYLKAAVKYNSGNKVMENNELFNTKNIRFITYYRDIKEDMRIEFNEKRYKILSITEIGFKEGFEIIGELINE